MKNVTGVRRNGVLYGWRLRPRINHFSPCPTPARCFAPHARAISASTLYSIIFIIIMSRRNII